MWWIFLFQILFAEEYSRKSFKHWVDTDKDCQNTRHEILIERSLDKVIFKNKKQCAVVSGKWQDFYYDEILTKARDVDIDHIVPLKYAWEIGAKSWNNDLRKEFANDPDNLVITNKKYNRQKGAKSFLEWMPANRSYACKYAKQWFKVKEKYSLPVSENEKNNFELLKCEK